MRNSIVFMALAAALALPTAAIAEPAQAPPPGWDRALTAIQTHWQKKHPDDLIVAIKRFPSLFMDSTGDWFDVTYLIIDYGRAYCVARPHAHELCPLTKILRK